MNRNSIISTILGVTAILITSRAQASSYFYGYYYPDEHRFHTDQMSTDNLDDYSYDPGSADAQPVAQPEPGYIHIILPDDGAKVYFGDYLTESTGTDRLFTTAPVDPGNRFTYHVTAAWNESGQDLVVKREVDVMPGQTTVADFTADAVSRRSSPGVQIPQNNP